MAQAPTLAGAHSVVGQGGVAPCWHTLTTNLSKLAALVLAGGVMVTVVEVGVVLAALMITPAGLAARDAHAGG